MRLKKLMHGEWRHEVDMRGALKNTDPVAGDNRSAAVAASGVTASTVMSRPPQSRPAVSVDQATSN